MYTPDVIFPNLGIYIRTLESLIFSIGPLELQWYGVLVVSGFIAGYLLAEREARRTGQNPEDYTDFMFYLGIAAILGARLYYVIFSWDYYRRNPLEIFAIWEGGLAIYGGILAGSLTAYIFCKKRKLDFWVFADTAMPSLLIGQIIGRFGNFFNREAFGGHTDSLFAMMYKLDQVPFVAPDVLQNLVEYNDVLYIKVHPTFLYEAFWNLCLLIFIIVYRRRKRFNGELLAIYMVGYGLGRFWIEGLRTDQLMLFGTNFAVSQVLSIILLVVGVLALIKPAKILGRK